MNREEYNNMSDRWYNSLTVAQKDAAKTCLSLVFEKDKQDITEEEVKHYFQCDYLTDQVGFGEYEGKTFIDYYDGEYFAAVCIETGEIFDTEEKGKKALRYLNETVE